MAFSFAGIVAGGLGAVLQSCFCTLHISAILSFFFGGMIILAGFLPIFSLDLQKFVGKSSLQKLSQKLAALMLKDSPWPVFLFGFMTIALPCGQTVIVYSALALEADLWLGLLHGILFACFTSPALLLAMHAQNLFPHGKKYYRPLMCLSAVIVGGVAMLRGLAQMEMIPHLVLDLHLGSDSHIALF